MAWSARRSVQGLAALAIAGGIALTASAPAQAGVLDCTGYLSDRGYIVGPSVYLACEEAQEWDGHKRCFDRLVAIRVEPAHADEACFRSLAAGGRPAEGRADRIVVSARN